VDTQKPEHSTHIPLKPATEVLPIPSQNLLIFVGFHSLYAWGPNGEVWKTERLSWEGIRITGLQDNILHGTGWNMFTDQDVPFTVDLQNGTHTGGGISTP
jgi:hypothetical protein